MGFWNRCAWLAGVVFYCGAVAGCGGGASGSNGGGGGQNPIPALTSITPTSVVAGSSDLALTATGAGFVSGAAIQWRGNSLATTFVSSTQLRATVPAADLTASGSQAVTVMNPAPGGGESNSVTFTINPPNNPVPTLSSLAPPQASAEGLGSRSL